MEKQQLVIFRNSKVRTSFCCSVTSGLKTTSVSRIYSSEGISPEPQATEQLTILTSLKYRIWLNTEELGEDQRRRPADIGLDRSYCELLRMLLTAV